MRIVGIALAALLSGCGLADVGTAAATNAKLQAEQIKQGKETTEKFKQSLEAATRENQQRQEQAEGKSGG